ncbi:ABC transporter ATP-binding protein [Gluconobacter cerinus]|uniref:ABC transporter-like protein n=1 Tax=Gluconobacter cerinus TaxID=38307 RepID=A0A1B6VIM1_9PROT|nr:ABC transporter ATP-binding protein [Gluconobacter cerinus]OAJ67060.1 ABC transporter-like protein [Gluconobacter cerinus]
MVAAMNASTGKVKQPTVALSLQQVRKTYGAFVALHALDLDVQAGEFLAVLGPSGSGKSTVLSMIAGLGQPDSGHIMIDGSDTTTLPTHKRGVGVVFQNYALFPHMSVFQNIAFPLERRGVPKTDIRQKVEDVCHRIGLAHAMMRRPEELSGGQRQRVALARCLVYAPSIILMDEPLAALDKRMRNQLQNEIRQLHRDLGTTIIYVTHDQHEALTMADRICLMNNGKIEQLATPGHLYAAPETVFAAEFLGDSNIFECREVYEEDNILQAKALNGRLELQGPLRTFVESVEAFLVRPEKITLSALGDDRGSVNSVRGCVRDVIFCGPITRFVIDLEMYDLIVDQVSSAEETRFSVGDVVVAHWKSADCIALTSGQKQ